MRSSNSLAKIAPALVKALGLIEGAAKDSKNPHFKNDYASLESVIQASKGVLADHGLGLIQFPGACVDKNLSLETVIIHESGEWVTGETAFEIVLGKMDPQGVGSAITYARRYAQMAALNIPAVDDDGEAAVNHTEPPRQNISVTPEGKDWWGCEGAGPSAYQAKKDGLDKMHEDFRTEIAALSTAAAWREWCGDRTDDIKRMPKSWRVILRSEAEEKAAELGVDFNSKRAA